MKFMLSDYHWRSKNYCFTMYVGDRGDHSRNNVKSTKDFQQKHFYKANDSLFLFIDT